MIVFLLAFFGLQKWRLEAGIQGKPLHDCITVVGWPALPGDVVGWAEFQIPIDVELMDERFTVTYVATSNGYGVSFDPYQGPTFRGGEWICARLEGAEPATDRPVTVILEGHSSKATWE